ncbi:PREDICTED: uncharacterized protein LOC107337475 isoform X2 [Acropora digitifera]|uniref:uncharacterized protein LOC107337475 isoform X2 n=1 Tax=Acropora digitifera TaxID=70779 RepID=UPI00077A912D|nr:PREDICTED: uncharacterized protein LOC107337475 isoform X2 [Acropora digitifera]
MPDKCIVFGCDNRPSKTERISLHPIPFEGADEPEKRKRRKKWVDFDGIGICVFPTIQAPCVSGESKPESKRAERKRKKDALESPDIFGQKNVVDPKPKRRTSKERVASSSYLSPSAEKQLQAAEPAHEWEPLDTCEAEGIPAAEKIGKVPVSNQACASCVVLRNEKRKLSNTVKSLRKKINRKKERICEDGEETRRNAKS